MEADKLQMPNFAEIELKVRRWVWFFNSRGVETFWSCEGGNGHVAKFPTLIWPCSDPIQAGQLAQRIEKLLVDHGVRDFYSAVRYRYGLPDRPASVSVVVEFFGADDPANAWVLREWGGN